MRNDKPTVSDHQLAMACVWANVALAIVAGIVWLVFER